MKSILCKMYLPPSYFNKLHDQTYTLIQDHISVIECTQKFEELKICSLLVDVDSQAASEFKAGLKVEIKRELIRQSPATTSQT